MAKRDKAQVDNQDDIDSSDFVDMQPAKGSSLQSDDVKGFWNSEKSAIRCIPLHAKMFDGSIKETNIAILITAKLTMDCPLYVKDKESGEQERVDGHAGDLVGIWYKPGMRAILRNAGVDCYIKRTGTKDVGKPEPMILFDVVAPEGGKKLPLISDTRVKSIAASTPFDAPIKQRDGKSADDSMDNVPF